MTAMSTPLSSLLVANRGEIASRVFRTARSMGLRCVAVYADADVHAPFVAQADEAVRLAQGYLDGPAIIAAALATGAEAIHPGYGFLSENAAFAAEVTAAGLTWVGPPPDVIEAMGDKLAAKRAAIEAGVPTLRSSDDPAGDGDSSTIFWWRRCIEHSRSPRWTSPPWASPRIWISTWRARAM